MWRESNSFLDEAGTVGNRQFSTYPNVNVWNPLSLGRGGCQLSVAAKQMVSVECVADRTIMFDDGGNLEQKVKCFYDSTLYVGKLVIKEYRLDERIPDRKKLIEETFQSIIG